MEATAMAQLKPHEFDSRTDLDIWLAREIAAALETAISERGSASLAVSGGRTPLGMFQQLRQMRLDWDKVWITLVDDRWLPADHPDSNEALVREHLLKYQLAAAHFVPLKTVHEQPAAALADIDQRLRAIPQPFDVVVLGMGDDGHTASLFPCAAELEAAADPANPRLVAALQPMSAPYGRISLTLATIARARNLLLHITGSKKKQIFEAAMAASAAEPHLPVRRVLDRAPGVCHVFWAE
ncbi:6-phosphogluconolactonase [Chitinimonas lacunae]|uniref:6-phosphogluconolactonase n=1 Tax=Chitinimonas lacunae TaxID=1963018 RepID=A0ABV8ML12_9NEIS